MRGFETLADEYEVVVERLGDSERLTLKIEFADDAAGGRDETLAALKNELRLKTNLGYAIEVHPLGTLTRYEVKARRFKDLRPKH